MHFFTHHVPARQSRLLTPTNRLSRHLQSQYAAAQIKQGQTSWPTPDVLSWTAWLQRSWHAINMHAESNRFLLNACQQQALWQEIIANSPYAKQLLHNTTTARQAIAAWNLLQQWQLTAFPDDIYLSEDARVFNSWAATYQQKCASENWIDEASLATVYRETVLKYNILPHQSLALLGFYELTPQQHSLFACLEQMGCRIVKPDLEQRRAMIRQGGFADLRQELRAAAHWARHLLERNPAQGKAASIGIVIPNLQHCRHIVAAEFDDVLLPAAILSAADIEQRPYSISLGRALNEYPLIDTALLLMGLLRQPVTLDAMSLLLRSPFIKAAASEQQSRAQLDAALHEHGEARFFLNTLLHIATNRLEPHQISQDFINCLLALKELMQALPARQTPVQWIATVSRVLNIFAWPGERSLNSAEYQIVDAWQTVMERFASLELVTPALSQSEALSQLHRLVTEFSFQPETAEAPIQILGMIAAAEMQFDHLWLLGLHEEIWPPPARPDPFIPISLQRECRMPGASAGIELEYARNMTQHLVNSSPDVILSYPQNEKERALRPSPLLRPYLEAAAELYMQQDTSYAQQILQSQHLETLVDNSGPAVKRNDKARGGTALFKDQSACAFRAFAKHRLHARTLSEVDIGLDALARGSLIHDLMQLFWTRVKSQQSLSDMGAEALDKLIHDCAAEIMSRNREQYPHTYTERFTKLETARLQELLQEWLQQELRRSAFIVKACEQNYVFTIEGIEVRTRIDRIDELGHGKQLIVDYKTGKPRVADWFGERLDDPQLPLYAISSDVQVAALAFARIKRGEMAYIGLAEDSDILPGTKAYSETSHAVETATWPALLTAWKQVLSALAIAFREGEAAVNPKNVQTCQYCDLHAFCRIDEKRIKATAEME